MDESTVVVVTPAAEPDPAPPAETPAATIDHEGRLSALEVRLEQLQGENEQLRQELASTQAQQQAADAAASAALVTAAEAADLAAAAAAEEPEPPAVEEIPAEPEPEPPPPPKPWWHRILTL